MANEVKVIISAIDEASSVFSGVSGNLGKMNNAIATGAKVALAGVAVGIGAFTAGLAMSVKEAADSEDGLAQLDAALKSTAAAHEAAGTKTVWVADAVNKLAGQTTTLTTKTDALAGASKKHLAEIEAAPAKLETATARLHDMDAAYGKAKTHTESATLALKRQREEVALLSGLVAEGANRYGESNSVVAAMSGHWDKVSNSTQVSRQTILDLADSIQKTTKFADDDVIAASNMMLTFTAIGKDVFPDTIKAALDMSQALGQDVKSSAMQLGKALNSPVEGVSALQRVGVKLTDAQKKQVEAFMKVNDIASAQKVILKELQTEFGGSAEAAGNTFSGKMAILGHAIDDVKQKIGDALLPVLSTMATKLSETLGSPIVQKGIDDLAKGIGAVAEKVLLAVAGLFTLADTMKRGVEGGADPFAVLNVGLNTFLTSMGMSPAEAARMAAGISVAAEGLSLTVSGMVTSFDMLFADIRAGASAGDVLGNFAGNIAQTFGAAEADAIALSDAISTIYDAFASGDFTQLQAMVGGWADILLNWIQVSVVPFIGEKLNALWLAISAWISAQGVQLGIKLGEWATAFMGWIQNEVLPNLPEKLRAIGLAIGEWIGAEGKRHAERVRTEWIPAFTKWVGSAITWLVSPEGLSTISKVMFEWLIGIPLKLAGAIAIMASGIIDGIINGIGGDIKRLNDYLFNIIKSAIEFGLSLFGIKIPIASAPARADGGPVSAGNAYTVGERGPELFVPSTSGSIIPTGSALAAGASSGVASVNVYLDGNLIGQAMGNLAYLSKQGVY